MKKLLIIGLVLATLSSRSQSTNITTLFLSPFEKAEKLYQQLAYRNALEIYLFEIGKRPDNYQARQRVAECYFRLGEIEKAETAYATLASLPQGEPLYKYQYAQVLSIQGKYGEAEKWFAAYEQTQTKDTRSKSKLDFLYSLSYYFRDSVLYTIANEPYNSDQSDFAPHYHGDRIVFVSARDRDLFIKRKSLSSINKNESHLNVYSAPKSNIIHEEDIVPFYKDGLKSILHDGPIAFFDSEKQIAFTRNNTRNGKPHVNKFGRVNLKLYFARLDEDGVLNRLTEFPFNNDDYSVGHPWVSGDGQVLYFASDMPGGIGGVDLYRSEQENGKWSKPINLGPNVNTLGDEVYPFVLGDSVMYYSSNGHGGLGGLDIFITYKNKLDQFSHPVNLGFPLNTSSDDFSLVLDQSGREGLFASNREGGIGYDDIYRFKINSFSLIGKVVEQADSINPIPHATVALFDDQGVVIGSQTSDANGFVYFDLDFDRNYSLSADKEDYSWVNELLYTTETRFMGSDSVLIPLWGHSLLAKGTVYSNESQAILPDATVIIENILSGEIQQLRVDSTGIYNFKIEPNRQYIVKAMREGFLEEEFTLNTKGIYKGVLINDLLLEEVFVEKAVVQFDFDNAKLSDAGTNLLEPILKALKRDNKATLNIGAHADSYGTEQYNKSLSERRAQSVKGYFVSRGIAPQRIEAIGFGEELLLNRCSNGTECSEEEHSKNRRAEIKVQLQ
ncbi:MAG: OmpA family protein [Cyclobacteriaceae bacterium]